MDKNEFRAALKTLGLSRSQFADIIGRSWTTIDDWYDGMRGIPKYVDIVLLMWLHQDLPEVFKPVGGNPYEFIVPEGYYAGQTALQLSRNPSSETGSAGQ